jgi:subtilisin family serine protease
MAQPSPRPPAVRRPRTARSESERALLRRALETQVGQLHRRLTEGESLRIERALIESFIADRMQRDDVASIRILREDDHPVLVARDTMLALADDFTDDEKQQLGVVPIAGTRILRVPSDRLDKQRVERFRPNYVTAMGVVVKALGGPEPPGRDVVAPERLPVGRGTPLKVAVIDTGISSSGRDDGWLQGLETDANADPLYPNPSGCEGLPTLGIGAGHGTFVTGVVAQLAPAATINVFNPLKLDGLGTEDDVAAAMIEAFTWGADIINLSMGMETDDDEPPLALQDVVRAINEDEREVLIIAAAGNTGRDRPCWPGALDGVTAVAGLTVDMKGAPWSTRGPWVNCSTIGEGVMSTYVQGVEDERVDDPPDEFDDVNSWALWSGTSFAAPQITGAVAQIAQRQGIGPREALDRLLRRRRHVKGYGKVLKLLRPADIDSPVAFGPIG